MSKSMTDPLAAMTGANAELFKLWISLWPVAPAFGVEWRFAEMMPKGGAFDPMSGMAAMPPMPGMEAMTAFWTGAASAAEAPKAKAKPAPKAAKPAPKAKAKAAAKPEAKTEPAPDPVVVPLKPKAAEPATPVEPAKPAVAEAPELDLASLAPTAEAPAGRPAVLFETAPKDADDLQMIKGIGPGLESKLNALGIYKLDQIAGFSEADLQWIDENLTTFKGRCFRDDWVGQAKGLLA